MNDEITRISLDSIKIEAKPVIRLTPKPLQEVFGDLMLPEEISIVHSQYRAILTRFAHYIILAGAKTNCQVAYLDSGRNFSPQLVRSFVRNREQLTSILEQILVARPLNFHDLLLLLTSSTLSSLKLIIVDNLAGLLNFIGAPGSVGRQRTLFKILGFLRKFAVEKESHILITDHSGIDWTTGNIMPIGGMVLAHAVDSIFYLNCLEEKGVFRLIVERSSRPVPFDSVILKINLNGIKPISNGV